MTSRERILLATNHKEPDRIPVDFSGHRSSGIMVQAYKRLRAHLGLPERELYVYDFIQQLALVEDDVFSAFGADVVETGRECYREQSYWQDFQLQDGTRCKIPAFIPVVRTPDGYVVYGDEDQVICIQKNGCHFFEQTCFPLADRDDMEFRDLDHDLSQIMWCRLGIPPAPAGFDESGMARRALVAKMTQASTDKAVYGTFGGNLIEIGEFAFRIDNFLYELAAEPARIHAFLDKLTEYHMRNLDKYLDAVGDSIDIIGFGDDLGMQTGPQISPKMYREFFKPRHRLMWQHVKMRKPHLKVSLHCCGGVYPLLEDLIDAGLDIINPVQFTCTDMELPRLKREFGDRLVFWGGGCDTRYVLPSGTPEEVADHVKRNIEIMRPGGGFVFQQVHNILADVPPQNIVAMFQAVRDSG